MEWPDGFSRWIVEDDLMSTFGIGIVVPAGIEPTAAFMQVSVVFLASAIASLVLLAAAIVYGIARVFEYGTLLQQQADETL